MSLHKLSNPYLVDFANNVEYKPPPFYDYEYFQNYWYVRPIGFGMATLVFGILTWLLLGETPDNRTIITLFLSALIIAIQLSHLFIK